MPSIPNTINGVDVELGPNVVNSVNQRIVDALDFIIKPDIATGCILSRIYVSSANDQHQLPSRHVQADGKAVDISRINGHKLSTHYPSDPTVRAIVDALQAEFESYPHRRENFGPYFKKKLGNNFPVGGHGDHVHLSVN